MSAILRFLLTLTLVAAVAWASPVVISASKDSSADAAASFRHHYKRVRPQMVCSEPQPRVICMQDVLPNPSKRYVPECTVLRVCAKDTGCCAPGQRCGPKTHEEVTLHFSVFDGRKHSTEAITFVNDETCGCQDINDIPKLIWDHKKISLLGVQGQAKTLAKTLPAPLKLPKSCWIASCGSD